jgi:hypothetical protein
MVHFFGSNKVRHLFEDGDHDVFFSNQESLVELTYSGGAYHWSKPEAVVYESTPLMHDGNWIEKRFLRMTGTDCEPETISADDWDWWEREKQRTDCPPSKLTPEDH